MEGTAVVLLSLVATLACTATAAGQSFCDPEALHNPPASPADYSSRHGGEYCDGKVFVLNGGKLELVSIEKDQISGNPASVDVSLGASLAPDQRGSVTLPVQIMGSSLDPKGYYRFDGEQSAWEKPIILDKNSGLAVLGAGIESIGWLAWTSPPGQERVYLPVGQSGGARDRTTIYVRPALRAVSVDVVIRSVGSGQQSPLFADTVAQGVKAGVLVSFSLPATAPALIEVEVKAVSPAGRPSTIDFLLLH